MKKTALSLVGIFLGLVAGRAAPDDALFTAVLRAHVDERGLVDYAALKTDARLEDYLASVAATDPAQLPGRAAQLAFWINAYNAYTLKLIVDNYPVKTINELATGGKYIGYLTGKTAWDIKFAEINGERMTLNHIEHDVIRERFKEPRIHFALVCAAVSCPPLRREAFTAEQLDAQLNEQAEIFLRDDVKNRFDARERRAELSKVFDWFKEDFGDTDAAVIAYASRFASWKTRRALLGGAARWSLGYTHYDWGLNDQAQVNSAAH